MLVWDYLKPPGTPPVNKEAPPPQKTMTTDQLSESPAEGTPTASTAAVVVQREIDLFVGGVSHTVFYNEPVTVTPPVSHSPQEPDYLMIGAPPVCSTYNRWPRQLSCLGEFPMFCEYQGLRYFGSWDRGEFIVWADRLGDTTPSLWYVADYRKSVKLDTNTNSNKFHPLQEEDEPVCQMDDQVTVFESRHVQRPPSYIPVKAVIDKCLNDFGEGLDKSRSLPIREEFEKHAKTLHPESLLTSDQEKTIRNRMRRRIRLALRDTEEARALAAARRHQRGLDYVREMNTSRDRKKARRAKEHALQDGLGSIVQMDQPSSSWEPDNILPPDRSSSIPSLESSEPEITDPAESASKIEFGIFVDVLKDCLQVVKEANTSEWWSSTGVNIVASITALATNPTWKGRLATLWLIYRTFFPDVSFDPSMLSAHLNFENPIVQNSTTFWDSLAIALETLTKMNSEQVRHSPLVGAVSKVFFCLAAIPFLNSIGLKMDYAKMSEMLKTYSWYGIENVSPVLGIFFLTLQFVKYLKNGAWKFFVTGDFGHLVPESPVATWLAETAAILPRASHLSPDYVVETEEYDPEIHMSHTQFLTAVDKLVKEGS